MVVGGLAHQLLLAAVGAMLFFAHRRLGLLRTGMVASSASVLFVQSTYLPQSFWSENVSLFLVTAVLWLSLHLALTPDLSRRSLWSAAGALGLASELDQR